MPKVSVTLTAYNAEAYLEDALQSVLQQSMSDFELIVVDDGSTDHTWDILQRCTDHRLIAVRHAHDYVGSLNCAQQMAKGEFIARMDADDMMHPERLSMQIALLERHPEIDICTTWMRGFDHNGKTYTAVAPKGELEQPLLHLLQRNDCYHPTAMVRRSFWQRHHLRYDAAYTYAEDYHLWMQCATLGATFFVIPQCLHYYRMSEQQVSRTQHKAQGEVSRRIQHEIVEQLIASSPHAPALTATHAALRSLQEADVITHQELMALFHRLLTRAAVSQ